MSTATAVKITFDTHAYVRTLKNAGFTETQAEGLSDGLALAMNQGVATHEDIVGLNGRIDALDIKIDGTIDKAVIRLGMFMTALVTVAVAVLSLVIVNH